MALPHVIYDANIWSKLSFDDINSFICNADNYLIDDTAAELYRAGIKYTNNTIFQQKLALAFNQSHGLNKDFTLVLFEVPWRLPLIYENTYKVVNPKNDPFTCSLYHYWLRYAISPAILIDPIICENSALTMLMLNQKESASSQSNDEIEKKKNRARQAMLRRIKNMFANSPISPRSLVGAWRKRDESIRTGRFKLTDYREVLFALIKLIETGESTTLLTADYDIVDIQNNIYLSIIDQYVIETLLLQRMVSGEGIIDIPSEVVIDRKAIEARVDETYNNIETSTEYASLVVMLYSAKDNKLYPFENKFPGWLLRFLRDYRGNSNCLSLKYNPDNIYCLRYNWYRDTLTASTGIKFDVWLDVGNDEKLPDIPFRVLESMSEEEIKAEKNKACFPMICKSFCQYEKDEYDNPERMSPFTMDK